MALLGRVLELDLRLKKLTEAESRGMHVFVVAILPCSVCCVTECKLGSVRLLES